MMSLGHNDDASPSEDEGRSQASRVDAIVIAMTEGFAGCIKVSEAF